MDRFIMISGCSGGGKSTLLAELKRRGHAVVEEPGRRIIAEETKRQGLALPWVNLAAFARRAITMALDDRERAQALTGPVFFDRGLVDAAVALHHATGEPFLPICIRERYNPVIFMAPPWPELYQADEDRRHGLEDAIAEYERLIAAYRSLGYRIALLPKTSIAARADMLIHHATTLPR
ncbi:MAG: ATPase [Sphingomonadales bacterium]|nr:MAG: ATPase [Sphingomonadales bacterium]TNF02885.1 MAG: ATPase [Sphingomonadales bacterium]